MSLSTYNEIRKSLLIKSSTMFYTIPMKKSQSSPLNRLENIVFVCEPNASRLEYHVVETRTLDHFITHKFNVVLFNYAGYNANDQHKTSLDVISKGNEIDIENAHVSFQFGYKNKEYMGLWQEYRRLTGCATGT